MEKIKENLKYIVLGIIILFMIISVVSYIKVDNDVITKDETIKKESTVNKVTGKYYVDIKGAVKNPGVYKLKENSRVIDVINASGGLLEDADTSVINLSKIIEDEMVIIIYTKDEVEKYKNNEINSTSSINQKIEENTKSIDSNNDAEISKKSTVKTNSKININTSDKNTLLKITGIGESKANNIIKYREEKGNFNSIEEIKNVSGIGDSLYEKIKNSITTK